VFAGAAVMAAVSIEGPRLSPRPCKSGERR
jgi:hypothetical protein